MQLILLQQALGSNNNVIDPKAGQVFKKYVYTYWAEVYNYIKKNIKLDRLARCIKYLLTFSHNPSLYLLRFFAYR